MAAAGAYSPLPEAASRSTTGSGPRTSSAGRTASRSRCRTSTAPAPCTTTRRSSTRSARPPRPPTRRSSRLPAKAAAAGYTGFRHRLLGHRQLRDHQHVLRLLHEPGRAGHLERGRRGRLRRQEGRRVRQTSSPTSATANALGRQRRVGQLLHCHRRSCERHCRDGGPRHASASLTFGSEPGHQVDRPARGHDREHHAARPSAGLSVSAPEARRRTRRGSSSST